MLFSEPKIPQSLTICRVPYQMTKFQCSSASRKFLNQPRYNSRSFEFQGFSALQRAENSSISPSPSPTPALVPFQCSSASRKFLNAHRKRRAGGSGVFQCSSASRKFLNDDGDERGRVTLPPFQCSSASRKFLNPTETLPRRRSTRFQCSSASRKFLN